MMLSRIKFLFLLLLTISGVFTFVLADTECVGRDCSLDISIKVVAGPNGDFSGTVRNSSGELIANANIAILETNDSIITATGAYTITGVPVGTYSLNASADGHLSQIKTGPTIVAAETTIVDFVLSLNTGTFAGEVKSSTGELIPNTNMTVLGTGDSIITATGSYELTEIPIGSHSLQASADGHLSQTKTNQFITIETTTTVDFTLSPVGNMVGNVLDFFTSNGINNANVTLIQFSEVLSSTLTDATGYYEFTDLAPGYYDLTVSGAGYTTNSIQNNQVLGSQNTTVNFWLW